MLNANVYEQALNRYTRNMCTALNNQDRGAYEEHMRMFQSLCHYCSTRHQLLLTTRENQFALKRSGCTPSNLHIIIDGENGYGYAPSPLQRRYWHRDVYGKAHERNMSFAEYCATFATVEEIKRYHADLLPEIISNAITTYWYCGTHPQTALVVIGDSYYCRNCNGVAAKIIDASEQARREFLDSAIGDEEYAAYLEHISSPGADTY